MNYKMAKQPRNIAVIGAGIAGLACARTLAQAGHRVTVLDKSSTVGGRLASCETPFGTFDHGTQYFTVRDARFQKALAITPGLCKPWSANAVRVLDPHGRVAEAALPAPEPHWVAVPAMDALPRHWAEPLAAAGSVVLETRVTRIERVALDPVAGDVKLPLILQHDRRNLKGREIGPRHASRHELPQNHTVREDIRAFVILASIDDFVEDSGEGRWTVAAAIEEDVPAEVLTTALFARFRSRRGHWLREAGELRLRLLDRHALQRRSVVGDVQGGGHAAACRNGQAGELQHRGDQHQHEGIGNEISEHGKLPRQKRAAW